MANIEFKAHVETVAHLRLEYSSRKHVHRCFSIQNQRLTVLNIIIMLWRAHLWHFSISSKIKARHFMFSCLPNARALVHENDCYLTATSLLSKKKKKKLQSCKNKTKKLTPFSITLWEAEVLDLDQSFSSLF